MDKQIIGNCEFIYEEYVRVNNRNFYLNEDNVDEIRNGLDKYFKKSLKSATIIRIAMVAIAIIIITFLAIKKFLPEYTLMSFIIGIVLILFSVFLTKNNKKSPSSKCKRREGMNCI